MGLGGPWQFDEDTNKGKDNTYPFLWKSKKIILVPQIKSPLLHMTLFKTSKPLLLNIHGLDFIIVVKLSKTVMALVVKKLLHKTGHLPPEVEELLNEFKDPPLDELPCEFSTLQNLQHQIHFILGARLPNVPYHRMSPKKHVILQGMVKDLLQKCLVTKSPVLVLCQPSWCLKWMWFL